MEEEQGGKRGRRSGGEGVKGTEEGGADLRGPHNLFLKDLGFYTVNGTEELVTVFTE